MLYLSDFDHPEQLKILVFESWNDAVLESNAANTVGGESWFNCYMSSLRENETQKVQCHPVSNTYRLGDGKLFPALPNVDIPIY